VAWFKKHRPEVVISQHDEILGWLNELGVNVPNETGFVHLNCPTSGEVAGIFQNNIQVGQAAVDFLVGMIFRNKRGVPVLPHSVLVEGTWMEGPTLLPSARLRTA